METNKTDSSMPSAGQPNLSTQDKVFRIVGSIIGGAVLGGTIGSSVSPFVSSIGALIGTAIGLVIAVSDVFKRSCERDQCLQHHSKKTNKYISTTGH